MEYSKEDLKDIQELGKILSTLTSAAEIQDTAKTINEIVFQKPMKAPIRLINRDDLGDK